jgi:hypothetical protein
MPSARSDDDRVVEALAVLSRAFAKRGHRWYVFGAQAVILWTQPRATFDLDVTVFLGTARTSGLVRDLERAGFARRPGLTDQVAEIGRVLPMQHVATELLVDVVLGGPGIEEEFAARAVPVRIGKVDVPVISAEDLIALKVLASRPKDLLDVRGILASRGRRLDLDRVRGVLGRLEAELAVSDLTPQFEALLRDSKRRAPPKPPRPAKRR